MCRAIKKVSYLKAGQPQEYKKPQNAYFWERNFEILPKINLEITLGTIKLIHHSHTPTYTHMYTNEPIIH